MNEKIIVTRSFYSVYVKRCIDCFLSGIGLITLSPLFVVVVFLEWIIHSYPAIYKSKRPGKNKKVFLLYKFRSMTNERDENGLLLPEEQRLTKFGKFIRKTSIDELPQLVNIFKGDMAIIGPRPLLIEYNELYTPRHAVRLEVRPGLVCLTDNKAKGPVTWRTQFESDVNYVQNITFKNDLKMFFAVIGEVFKHADYRAMDTRIPFDGTNLDDTRSKSELNEAVHFDSLQ